MFKKGAKYILDILVRGIEGITLPFNSNKILIVRLDAIGDYILFRNFLYTLKSSKKYGKYKYTLLGNIIYKELAETFDAELFESFIWIKPNTLVEKFGYGKIRLMLQLKLKRFDVLINPVHSKIIFIDKFLATCGAKKKIASSGDEVNSRHNFELSNSYYDEIIAVSGIEHFEFFRNKLFIENITGEKFETELKFNRKKKDGICKIIVIVPGAGSEFRRWSTLNFSILIDLITTEINAEYVIQILGSAEETSLGEEIILKSKYKKNIQNLAGTTTLVEVIDIINNANLVISNETSTVHIAAALNTNAICISNGNHFGRFNPYPASLRQNILTVYPNTSLTNKEMVNQNAELYKFSSDLNINDIHPEKVLKLVVNLLD